MYDPKQILVMLKIFFTIPLQIQFGFGLGNMLAHFNLRDSTLYYMLLSMVQHEFSACELASMATSGTQ